MLPEYALRADEIAAARQLVSAAPANIAAIFGVAQLSQIEVAALENDDLWDGNGTESFTNCAMVCVGQSDSVYLQPKIVPSQWEPDHFLRGRVIRYFAGRNVSFVVQICSDLLPQPGAASNANQVAAWVSQENRRLTLVFWLQHNPEPRSAHFVESLRTYATMHATVISVSSRAVNNRGNRLENYAVSGGIVHHSALPRHFRFLDREFHYVEPLRDAPASRIVLLRYDADAHLAQTALADDLVGAQNIARNGFFLASQPYVYVAPNLVPSPEHFHIEDLLAPAEQLARNYLPPARHAALASVIAGRLIPLTARQFLAFLDISLLARPMVNTPHHLPGEIHGAADYNCHCWDHRRCVDLLTETGRDSTVGLGEVLVLLALLSGEGLDFNVVSVGDSYGYLEVQITGTPRYCAVVFPFNFDAGEVERRLIPQHRPPAADVGYLVLGTSGRSRPLLADVHAARPARPGATGAAAAVVPTFRALFHEQLQAAIDGGTLAARVAGFLTA